MHVFRMRERLLGTSTKTLAEGTTQEGPPQDDCTRQFLPPESALYPHPSTGCVSAKAYLQADSFCVVTSIDWLRVLPYLIERLLRLSSSAQWPHQCSAAMFGSSQDRARQLAGRKRRERISSSGSNSTLRSISSSSHASQQYHIKSTLTPCNQESAVIKENPQTLQGHQILQAEYLSQVLYSDLGASASASASPPQSQFRTSLRQSKYGSMEMSPAVTRHLRNVTAPATEMIVPDCQALHQRVRPGVAFTRPLERSTSESHLRSHAAVSLRGGQGGFYVRDHTESREYTCTLFDKVNDKKEGLPLRPFTREFPWVTEVYCHPQWHVPISSGASYEAFIESLSMTELERFIVLFSNKPRFLPVSLATARQVFFIVLTAPQQKVFKNIIISRGMALHALAEGGIGVQCTIHPATSNPEANPAVMLEHLLEATERPELLARHGVTKFGLKHILRPTLSFVEEAQKVDLTTEYRSYAFLSTFDIIFTVVVLQNYANVVM